MDDLFDDLMDLGGDDVLDLRRTEYKKAPFGLPGGKSRSLKYILPRLPLRKKWVDHFGGSGIVSWNRPPCPIMVYNDRYSGVVDFYRVLQSNRYEELLKRLKDITPPLSREEWLYSRATWCTTDDAVERAARWFYMVKNSVIGKGQAFARATNSRPPIKMQSALELFTSIHQILQSYTIENLDFRTCFKDYDSCDCVHYFDPPYIDTDSSIYEYKWTRRDLNDLLSLIEHAEGFCALSGYADTHIDACDFWTDRVTWKVPLTSDVMDVQGKEYEYAEEVLWIKE